MNALFDINDWLSHIDALKQLPLKTIMFYAGQIVAVLFTARSIVTYFARTCGFYHPDHYRLWPHLPWRPVYRVWLGIEKWYERVFLLGKRGSTGGFASTLETFALLYTPDRILLGRAYAFGAGLLQPVGISVSRHICILAMTGAGKTSALITILSTWTNSVFLIDPKSQVTYALAHFDWRKWFVIDPYGISPFPSASFNAFDCMVDSIKRDGENTAVLWASRIAFALISTPAGSRSPYFYDVARSFLSGLILHVYTEHPETDWNLPFVRQLIVEGLKVHNDDGQEETKGSEAHDLLLYMMSKNSAFGGAISGAAAAMIQAGGSETGGNLWSTLQDQTRFLDLPAVCAVLRETSLPLSDLKTRNDVVLSLTAPILSIRQELAPLARLLTNMIAYSFEAVKEKNGSCLSMIDELPSQGYNETFLTTLAVGRSQGQLLVGIAQNLGQLKSVYPKDYATFIGEADAVYWMGSAHAETTETLARLLGKKTIIDKDRYTGRKSYREVDVMDADQVRRFLNPDSQNIIITRAGNRALRLKNEPYFKALPVWKYLPDPDHTETIPRRITRAVLGCKRKVSPESKTSCDENAEFSEPFQDEENANTHEPANNQTEETDHD